VTEVEKNHSRAAGLEPWVEQVPRYIDQLLLLRGWRKNGLSGLEQKIAVLMLPSAT
jgi:hypothetical protein